MLESVAVMGNGAQRPAIQICLEPAAFLTIMRSGLVAIVEDDPIMRRGLKRLLNALGYEAETFESAEAFLLVASESRAKCLVVDIGLPGISGIEMRRRLKDPRLSIIFMTAADDEYTRRQAMDAGCVAYLQKPFTADVLNEAIRKAPG